MERAKKRVRITEEEPEVAQDNKVRRREKMEPAPPQDKEMEEKMQAKLKEGNELLEKAKESQEKDSKK